MHKLFHSILKLLIILKIRFTILKQVYFHFRFCKLCYNRTNDTKIALINFSGTLGDLATKLIQLLKSLIKNETGK